MELNTGSNNINNHLDDVFMTDIDEHSSQKIISQIEEKRELESIKNVTKTCKFSQHIMMPFLKSAIKKTKKLSTKDFLKERIIQSNMVRF